MTIRRWVVLEVARGLLNKFGNLTRVIPDRTAVKASERIMASELVKRHHIKKIPNINNPSKIVQMPCYVCSSTKRNEKKRCDNLVCWVQSSFMSLIKIISVA